MIDRKLKFGNSNPAKKQRQERSLIFSLFIIIDPHNCPFVFKYMVCNILLFTDAPSPSWENLEAVMKAIKTVVQGLVDFIQTNGSKHLEILTLPNLRYKTSMCRDLVQRGTCPRGGNCTFAHSPDELEK